MNNLRIEVTVPSLSVLTPIGTNQYQVVVKALTTAGAPLNNPNINNVSTIIVNTTTTTFNVDVPVIDGNWTINDMVLKVFSDNASNCCFATGEFDVTNTQSETPGENTLEIVAYFSQ